ncbi:MAG: hypothetical protein LH470_04180 [Lysobacter sp.]|nr:hypothetical protein [Lysobacter sp.]
MDISTFANLVSALAVVIGVAFAMVQLRYHRLARQREGAMALVQSFETLSSRARCTWSTRCRKGSTSAPWWNSLAPTCPAPTC